MIYRSQLHGHPRRADHAVSSAEPCHASYHIKARKLLIHNNIVN
jgi:hypothetical protein